MATIRRGAFIYGEGGVVVTVVGSSNTGLGWVVKAVYVGGGRAYPRRVQRWCCSTPSPQRCRKPPSRQARTKVLSLEAALSLSRSPELGRLCLEADPRTYKQIHAADGHVRKISGLVVAMAGGGGVGGQNMVEANEGMKVVGCEGVSRLPRQSRHNRHTKTYM